MIKKEIATYNKIDMGKRIRHLREKMGMTCHEMAERLGEAQETYAEIENGQCDMALETVLRLASLFHVAPDDLIIGTEEGRLEKIPEDSEDEHIFSLLANSGPRQRQKAFELMRTYLEE